MRSEPPASFLDTKPLVGGATSAHNPADGIFSGRSPGLLFMEGLVCRCLSSPTGLLQQHLSYWVGSLLSDVCLSVTTSSGRYLQALVPYCFA